MFDLRTSILISGALLVACGDAEPAALSVEGIAYTENELLGLSPERRETLAHLTAFGLAVAASSEAAIGAPLVDRWVDDRRIELLAAELTLERRDVGDDALRARYLTDPDWELVVRHLLFFSERWRSPQHREDAAAKAERAMARLQAGGDFPRIAAELSEEPGAEGREGLLSPGREGSWVPEFWAAALALEPGEISRVTETQYGYHILRLEDRRPVPFEEARAEVARAVARQIDDPSVALDAWLDEHAGADPDARRAAALEEARRRGIEVGDAERAEIARGWESLVYRWTAGLGFRAGLRPEQVKATALAALARAGQNAVIARRELDEHAELFRRGFEIRTAADVAS